MTEIIEEGINGLSFPAGDGKGLAKILLRLLEEPGILADLHRTIRPETVPRRITRKI